MKQSTFKTVLLTLFALAGFALAAQENETIFIEASRLVHPLIEKWTNEYNRQHPAAPVRVTTLPAGNDANNHPQIYAGRYALLPVSNANNSLLNKASGGLKKKDLVRLLFEQDVLDDDYDPGEKEKYTATVYSRKSPAPTTHVLAEHFKQSPDKIRGKKIIGEDIHLLNAIRKDESGIAFNAPSHIYDLHTRRLHSDLSLVPLNLKSRQKEALNSLDIDRTLSLLENETIETIPVANFGFSISKTSADSDNVWNFVEWILTHGQEYNHELGFLKLDSHTRIAQQKQLNDNGRLSFYSSK
jgi:ABC-type phosphate transport system substrate-binding protein